MARVRSISMMRQGVERPITEDITFLPPSIIAVMSCLTMSRSK